jgi:hypothetical protein
MYRIEIDDNNSNCDRLTWWVLEYADRQGLALKGPGYRDPDRDYTDTYDFVELDGFDRETFSTKFGQKYKSFKGELYKTVFVSGAEKQTAAAISDFKTKHGWCEVARVVRGARSTRMRIRWQLECPVLSAP